MIFRARESRWNARSFDPNPLAQLAQNSNKHGNMIAAVVPFRFPGCNWLHSRDRLKRKEKGKQNGDAWGNIPGITRHSIQWDWLDTTRQTLKQKDWLKTMRQTQNKTKELTQHPSQKLQKTAFANAQNSACQTPHLKYTERHPQVVQSLITYL